jgi:5-methylcytosine-specific restriction protein A
MRLSDITAESVRNTIAECDRLGREAFRSQYGYRAALEYELEYDGRRYDSKATEPVNLNEAPVRGYY